MAGAELKGLAPKVTAAARGERLPRPRRAAHRPDRTKLPGGAIQGARDLMLKSEQAETSHLDD